MLVCLFVCLFRIELSECTCTYHTFAKANCSTTATTATATITITERFNGVETSGHRLEVVLISTERPQAERILQVNAGITIFYFDAISMHREIRIVCPSIFSIIRAIFRTKLYIPSICLHKISQVENAHFIHFYDLTLFRFRILTLSSELLIIFLSLSL